MKAFLKSLTLENFKGVKKQTYQFGEKTSVTGNNGAGKTTISTAYYWLFSDKDTDLNSNPNIRPLDAEEVTPRVEAILEIDGKEVTVAKIQKRTVRKSKTDGKETVSLSNAYEVNSVEYGERDFKKRLEEYSFDFNLFLPLSHPDVFTGKKADEMRKVLFSMASSKTDLEIAEQTPDAKEVTELLRNYTTEEIKAMQTSTLRKIKEEYGKDGEILRAKIEGLEQAKVDIDVAELELQRNALKEQIAENKAKQEDASKQYEEYQKLADEVAKLKMQLSDMQRTADEKANERRNAIIEQISNKKFLLKKTNDTIAETESDIERTSSVKIVWHKNALERLRAEYKEEKERVFDESSLVCSYCKQEYPAEKKDALRAEFESHKEKELADITEKGNKAKADLDTEKETLRTLELELEEHKKSLEMLTTAISELETQLENMPEKGVDISDTAEYKSLSQQISDKESAMQDFKEDTARQQLKSELETLNEQLTEVEKQIATSENNDRIDEQISDLREMQRKYEQNKTNVDMIQYQLDLVSRKKNELLTDEVNNHFEIVKFIFFTYQKNGDYKEVCIPTIDGRLFGESTNTGREVLAKLDIIKGLQNFYGRIYPVFLDGAECLSAETRNRIGMDCQMIFLSVDDGDLRIE